MLPDVERGEGQVNTGYEIKFFDKVGQALETKEGTTYTFFADSLEAAHDHTWGLFALAAVDRAR